MATVSELIGTDIKHEGDFVKDANGALETISGDDNLRAAILRRLVTSPGSLVHRPNYGAGLKTFLNQNLTIGKLEELSKIVEDQLLNESRIVSVNQVSVVKITGGVVLKIGVQKIGSQLQDLEFTFFED